MTPIIININLGLEVALINHVCSLGFNLGIYDYVSKTVSWNIYRALTKHLEWNL